jgi:hypothetical protein
MGWNGEEPRALKELREIAMKDEDDLWSLYHQNDPDLKAWLEDPTLIVKEARYYANLGR